VVGELVDSMGAVLNVELVGIDVVVDRLFINGGGAEKWLRCRVVHYANNSIIEQFVTDGNNCAEENEKLNRSGLTLSRNAKMISSVAIFSIHFTLYNYV